jgi:hypothetical protein
MAGTPTPRIIYLNGQDTGLKAWSPNHAKSQVANIIKRRGALKVDEDLLVKASTTAKGRVDFVWPVPA